jgi:hypothetical protein
MTTYSRPALAIRADGRQAAVIKLYYFRHFKAIGGIEAGSRPDRAPLLSGEPAAGPSG